VVLEVVLRGSSQLTPASSDPSITATARSGSGSSLCSGPSLNPPRLMEETEPRSDRLNEVQRPHERLK